MAAPPLSDTIGVRRRRGDGEAKVRGATGFAADIPVHGLLHARLVLAGEAHARITKIDSQAALGVPGVVAVLTAADLPIAAGKGGRSGEAAAGGSRSRVRRSSTPASPSRWWWPRPRPPRRTAPTR